MRAAAVLLVTLALAPAASAQDETYPPCPPGVGPSASIRAADDAGSLTATHEISLLVETADRVIDEFTLTAPPGTWIGHAGGYPAIRVDRPGPVPITATWSEYIPALDVTCSLSAQTTLSIEPARTPRFIPPDRKARLMTQLEWFLRLGRDADLRPIEVHVRGVRRARVPSRSVPARKLVFSFRPGDRGVSLLNGRERAVRSAGWKFTAGFLHDGPRILMHGLQGVGRFGLELEFVQGGRRIGRTRIVGRCNSSYCSYRTVGPSTTAAAKSKPKRCKKGRVRVRVEKRSACRPAKKVLPRPKRGDPRLLAVQSALGADWSRLHARRGRRVPSLPKLLRRLGPRAPALLDRVTKRGLARVDALRARASTAQARAAAGCGDAPRGPRRQDSFTSNGGDGTTATVTATLGAEGAGVVMELSGRGLSVKVDLDLGLCEPNEVEAPSCSTAVGRLRGQIRYKLRVAIEVRKGDEDVWSQVLDVSRKTELEGWTDVDAKLDRVDIEDTETSSFTLGGSLRDFPPISVRTRIVRRTQVDMRSGAFDPGRSDISVAVDTAGLGGPDRADVEDGIAERGRADADRQFRAVIDKAIQGYRNREDAWQEPNRCATLEFSPAASSRRLRPAEGGSFTAGAIARQGGGASELDARLSNQVNATFSPTRAGGQRARFDYAVAASPAGDKVSATVRATSKAGVAQDDWVQDIDRPNPPPPAYVGSISGTASYDAVELGAGNSLEASWSGSVVLRRVPESLPPGLPGIPTARYAIESGSIQYAYTGRVGGCNVTGSAPVNLANRQDVSAFLHVYDGAPRSYQLEISMPLMEEITGINTLCDDPNDNGTDFDWAPAAGLPHVIRALLPGGPVADNWALSGATAGDNGPGTPDQTWQWVLAPSS